MSSAARRSLVIPVAAVVATTALAFAAARLERGLGDPAPLTGWALAGLFVFLSAFNARKRLAALPVGKASTWLALHAAGGAAALAVYWLHTRSVWPEGSFERALAGAFYAVSISGIGGYVLQRYYPPLLSATGVEVILERVPEETARLRERAEALVLDCTARTRSDVLARHYAENLDWFMRRPRNVFDHCLAGRAGRQWVRHQTAAVRRYLAEDERRYLDKLARLLYHKNDVDFHYAAQTVMKGWLLLHVPLAAAAAVLAVWHIILVHAYAL
ncbi:MAG: hypothetical protein HYZ75_03960 [Elusimicrobia bacterium]|nr:hypothetical protein [Elusimicrobiota bacterium]